jgi:hypothetical protein
MDYSNQEVQKEVSEFTITLLNDEIIFLPCIISENIIEERDGYISLELESSTYCQRLYDVFTNKELIKSIKRESILRKITDLTDVKRELIYDKYFKLDGFNTYLTSGNCVTNVIYTITFQSI